MAVRLIYDNDTFGQEYTDSNGNEEYVERGKGFEIDGIAEDTDTGELYYSVSCERMGVTSSFEIPKSEAMDVRYLKKWQRKGLDINDSNKFLLPEIFQRKEDEYIETVGIIGKRHSEAGVKKCTDGNGEKIYVYAGFNNPVTKSTYVGKFDLEPKGDRDTWFSFVKAELKDSVNLMFVISVAFASILLGVLKGQVDIGNFIVHLWGESSRGKTTMLNLAASVFGNPDEMLPNGLIGTWYGTKNALIRRVMSEGDHLGGILYGFDELSMLQEKNATDLIYSIASGVEKERLTRSAEIQPRLTGTYIALSTGERSILEKTNGNPGVVVRTLEIDSNAWTADSSQSERIKKVVKANYGFAAEEFGLQLGKWIQQNGMDALIEKYEQKRAFYCENSSNTERKERMSSRYAVILLAADFAKEFFGFEMDEEGICDFIIESENANSEVREGFSGVFNKLVSYIVGNADHFMTPDHDVKPVKNKDQVFYKPAFRERWGIIDDVKSTVPLPEGMYASKVAYVAMPFFDHIVCNVLGYEDSRAIRKYLKGQGCTLCEPDRDYIRKQNDGVTLKYIAVYLPGEEDRGAICRAEKMEKLFHLAETHLKLGELDKFKEPLAEILKEKDNLSEAQQKHLRRLVRKYKKCQSRPAEVRKKSLLFDDDADDDFCGE